MLSHEEEDSYSGGLSLKANSYNMSPFMKRHHKVDNLVIEEESAKKEMTSQNITPYQEKCNPDEVKSISKQSPQSEIVLNMDNLKPIHQKIKQHKPRKTSIKMMRHSEVSLIGRKAPVAMLEHIDASGSRKSMIRE